MSGLPFLVSERDTVIKLIFTICLVTHLRRVEFWCNFNYYLIYNPLMKATQANMSGLSFPDFSITK